MRRTPIFLCILCIASILAVTGCGEYDPGNEQTRIEDLERALERTCMRLELARDKVRVEAPAFAVGPFDETSESRNEACNSIPSGWAPQANIAEHG